MLRWVWDKVWRGKVYVVVWGYKLSDEDREGL